MNCRNLGMVFGHNMLKPKVASILVLLKLCICVVCMLHVCMYVCMYVCVCACVCA